MNIMSRFLFIGIILLTASIISAADVPYLTGRVTDNARILSAATSKLLSDSLKAHESRTGNQVAILTIPALDGQSIEDFAAKVFEEWKLGQKGKDNGILILVAPNDRRMRIEVGYGLEGTMTDLMSGRIVRDVMTPKFKSGDYNGGIADGAAAVIKVLEGGIQEETAGSANAGASAGKSDNSGKPDAFDSGMSISERILFGAFIFGIIGLFTIIGIFTPGLWFLYLFLIPFWAMFPIVVVGTRGALICLITYLIGFPVAKILLKKTGLTNKAKGKLGSKGKASIGGFLFGAGSGSRSSWSSGSSHSSGSSFSGGGGSSGGGGASGRW